MITSPHAALVHRPTDSSHIVQAAAEQLPLSVTASAPFLATALDTTARAQMGPPLAPRGPPIRRATGVLHTLWTGKTTSFSPELSSSSAARATASGPVTPIVC